MNSEMLKGFLYSELGNRGEVKAEKFIDEMTDYFDVEEITEQDIREAVGDLIKEQYVIYGDVIAEYLNSDLSKVKDSERKTRDDSSA